MGKVLSAIGDAIAAFSVLCAGVYGWLHLVRWIRQML